jgi:Flp pilus assembly protein TadG
MKCTFHPVARSRTRGGVAVEAALVFPILVLFLTVPLFLARYFWHYEVAQKAAHDAALFLSRVSNLEMKTLGPAGEVGAATLARTIATQELAELNPGGSIPPPSVLCEYQLNPNATSWMACNGALIPVSVKVSVVIPFSDPFFPGSTFDYGGADGLNIVADVPFRYVGH